MYFEHFLDIVMNLAPRAEDSKDLPLQETISTWTEVS